MNDLPDILDLLRSAVAQGASDIHLCSGLPPSMRLRGDLTPCHPRVFSKQECREMILGLLTETQRAGLSTIWSWISVFRLTGWDDFVAMHTSAGGRWRRH